MRQVLIIRIHNLSVFIIRASVYYKLNTTTNISNIIIIDSDHTDSSDENEFLDLQEKDCKQL